jgi:hypothetical protein
MDYTARESHEISKHWELRNDLNSRENMLLALKKQIRNPNVPFKTINFARSLK